MPTGTGSPVAAASQPLPEKAEEEKSASASPSAEPTPASDAPAADGPGAKDPPSDEPSPKPSEEETGTRSDGVSNGGGDGGGKGLGDNPAGSAMAKGGGGDGAAGEEEDLTVCITVHPPQKSGAAPVVLEPLAGVELVLQVRQMLSEMPQTCLYSAYRLIAVAPSGEEEDVWAGEGEEMNEYVELRSIAAVAARPEKAQVGVHDKSLYCYSLIYARGLLSYLCLCLDGVEFRCLEKVLFR